MTRFHLYQCDDPLRERSMVKANCEHTIRDAVAVEAWDTQAIGLAVDIPLSVCRKCAKKLAMSRYVYVVCERRELSVKEKR